MRATGGSSGGASGGASRGGGAAETARSDYRRPSARRAARLLVRGAGPIGICRWTGGCVAILRRRVRIQAGADPVLAAAVHLRVVVVEGADDVAHQPVTHHVLGMEVDEPDVRDVAQD